MKNYILIQNDGEIEINSFELIGASTKRGESGKIGFFGSGLKYSIAYMMRNGIDFKVFSGTNEIVFSLKSEDFRDKKFERICINGNPTSYTTSMGPTWSEDWFVLREIYCNAVDESNCQLIKSTQTVAGVDGKTRIYVELTKNLEVVLNDWDSYFSDERTPKFCFDKAYTSYLGSSDGSGPYNIQPVKVYNKTNGTIFRRGVRVGTNKRFMYDYEFQFVNINEDRTAKSNSAISYAFSSMMGNMCNEDWCINVLREGSRQKDGNEPDEYRSLSVSKSDNGISGEWEALSKQFTFVIAERSGKYAKEMSESRKEVLLLPEYFASQIKKAYPNTAILGMGRQIGDSAFDECKMTSKMEFLLKKVIESLKEMGYEVNFDIMAADFHDKKIMGHADIEAKTIYIDKETFNLGRRELAMTIIEENEHILSGKGDETRGFQTHLISKFLSYMEDKNALFL